MNTFLFKVPMKSYATIFFVCVIEYFSIYDLFMHYHCFKFMFFVILNQNTFPSLVQRHLISINDEGGATCHSHEISQ